MPVTVEPQPEPFLEVHVHRPADTPGLTGMCAGYESDEYRCDQLAAHLIEWLPNFALKWTDRQRLQDATAIAFVRRAAKLVYNTDKYKNRGEFGELLLHAVLRQVFGTIPAISKLYYKDSANNTVKGFDCVHVIANTQLELWIGEVKFYTDIDAAIRDVVSELDAHTQRDYLRDEFALIANKIDDNWPHAERLRRLLNPNTSLDLVFDSACIPVLLTYDSSVVNTHKLCDSAYITAFTDEITKHHTKFASKTLPKKVRIHLLLLPLQNKKTLVDCLHRRLEACQSI